MATFDKRSAQSLHAALRRRFKMSRRSRVLGCLLGLAGFSAAVQAESVTLSWNRSKDPTVSTYYVYYGKASGVYTTKVSAGNTTNATISGLVAGTTYYFVATARTKYGQESLHSPEMHCAIASIGKQLSSGGGGGRAPTPTPPTNLGISFTSSKQSALTAMGVIGHTYRVVSTQDLKTWTVIAVFTAGATGAFNLTDTNASRFSRSFYRIADISP